MSRHIFFFICIFTFFGLDAWSQRIFPMVPIYKEIDGATLFLGVQIPYESIGKQKGAIVEAYQQLRDLGLYTYPMYLDPSLIGSHKVGSGIIGTVKKYQGIIISNDTCVGICGLFGRKSSDPNKLILGESLIYGFNIRWSFDLENDGRVLNGLWINDPLSSLLQVGSTLTSGATAMDAALKALRFGNYRLKAQHRDGSSLDWPRSSFPVLDEVKLSKLPLPDSNILSTPLVLSSNLEKIRLSFHRNIQYENIWKEEFSRINDEAPIWKNEDAQNLVQKICDEIHAAHAGPSDLKPRCRVFASLTPQAFAYPGGDIFVSAGLLGVLPNVDSLIFFLAHEYGHIFARHTSQKMNQRDFRARFLGTVSLITNILSFGSGESASLIFKALGTNKVSVSTISMALKSSFHSYERAQESESDEIGIEMSINLGAHPGAILQGLKSLDEFLLDTFKQRNDPFLQQMSEADHDPISERIEKIRGKSLEIMSLQQKGISLARSLDDSYLSTYRIVKPIMNFYRLEMKGQALAPRAD